MLLPIYAVFLGMPRSVSHLVTLFYTLAIAFLMVSRLPVFSGKRVGTRVPPEMVGPLIVVVVLSIALLIAYPWILLTAGTLAYLASLPFGWLSYRGYERRSRDHKAEAAPRRLQRLFADDSSRHSAADRRRRASVASHLAGPGKWSGFESCS